MKSNTSHFFILTLTSQKTSITVLKVNSIQTNAKKLRCKCGTPSLAAWTWYRHSTACMGPPYWEATWRKRTVVRGFVATILAEFDDELHLFCWTCCQLLKTPSRTPRRWQAIRWCNWRRRHCKFSQAQSKDKSQPSEKKTRWSWNLWNLNQTVANRKPKTTLTTEMLDSFHGR
jgi:hypothetical protein